MQTELNGAGPRPVKPASRWSNFLSTRIRSRNILRGLLAGLLLLSFNVAPVWRALWRWHVLAIGQFGTIKDETGAAHSAWRWAAARKIRIHALPGIKPAMVDEALNGVRAMVREIGLDLEVSAEPLPEEVAEACRRSLLKQTVNGRLEDCLSFDGLAARLAALHKNQPCATVLLVDHPIAECWWAHGMASFNQALVLLEKGTLSFHLAKHETGHLLGYNWHDSLPLFVLGYPWEDWPWSRDTLMMLNGHNSDLSPRARDALTGFWAGLERKLNQRFWKQGSVPPAALWPAERQPWIL